MELDYKEYFEFTIKLVKDKAQENELEEIDKLFKMIDLEIPEFFKYNAPSNFPDLYFQFKYEYNRFLDYIKFKPLIGKKVVALGGSFSCGKSTFINSLIGKRVLPSGIEPTTAIPTYVVDAKESSAKVMNKSDVIVDVTFEDIKRISHGFSDEYNMKFAHLLSKILIEFEFGKFENIAFLDTPGYSKADSKDYSENTDEKIARVQLNSSDFIIWFVNVENGVLTGEDIKFLKTIDKNIPILIVVNKCDKKSNDDVNAIVSLVKETAINNGILAFDVLAYSSRKKKEFDSEQLIENLQKWNANDKKVDFAIKFKKLFMSCKEYYEEKLKVENRNLSRINKVIALNDSVEVLGELNTMLSEVKFNITFYKEKFEETKKLENLFFDKLKKVGSIFDIEILDLKDTDFINSNKNIKSLVKRYKENKNIKSQGYEILLKEKFLNMENKYLYESQKGFSKAIQTKEFIYTNLKEQF